MCGEAGQGVGVALRAQCIGGWGSRLSAQKNSLVRPPECFLVFFTEAKWEREREIVKTIWNEAEQL